MARGVKGFLASEAFNRLCWLLDGPRAVWAGVGWGDIIPNRCVGEVVGQDSIIKGRDVVAFGTSQLQKKTKKKVLHKPNSSYRAVTEDTAALDLHQSASVVQVDGDIGRDTTGVTYGEPENPIELNTLVVKTWLNI